MTKYYAHRLKINAQKMNDHTSTKFLRPTINVVHQTSIVFFKRIVLYSIFIPTKNIYQCSEIRSNMFTADNQKECKHFGNNIAFFVYTL